MGLAENIVLEPVSKLPLRDLTTVRADATIATAIRAMHDKRVGCVMVVDQNDAPMASSPNDS